MVGVAAVELSIGVSSIVFPDDWMVPGDVIFCDVASVMCGGVLSLMFDDCKPAADDSLIIKVPARGTMPSCLIISLRFIAICFCRSIHFSIDIRSLRDRNQFVNNEFIANEMGSLRDQSRIGSIPNGINPEMQSDHSRLSHQSFVLFLFPPSISGNASAPARPSGLVSASRSGYFTRLIISPGPTSGLSENNLVYIFG